MFYTDSPITGARPNLTARRQTGKFHFRYLPLQLFVFSNCAFVRARIRHEQGIIDHFLWSVAKDRTNSFAGCPPKDGRTTKATRTGPHGRFSLQNSNIRTYAFCRSYASFKVRFLGTAGGYSRRDGRTTGKIYYVAPITVECSIVEVKENEEIVRQGDEGDYLYVIDR